MMLQKQRMSRAVLLLCTSLILFSDFTRFCLAEEEFNPCENKFQITGLKSTENSVAGLLDEEEDVSGKTAIASLENHFETYREALVAQNRTKISGLHCIDKVEKQDKFSKFVGFGRIDGCVTQYIYRSENEKQAQGKEMVTAIENLSKWMNSYGDKIISLYQMDWTEAFSNDKYMYDEGHARECYGYRAIGYRVNGVWGIGTLFNNASYETDAKDNERGVLSEFISVQNGPLQSLPLKIAKCDLDKDNKTLIGYENADTMYWLKSGVARWEYGDRDDNSERYKIEHHFGIKQALGETARQKELLQDSGEPSNIAVLILPGLLALFPIGLFQEANINTIFLYSVVTDVVSVLPILIKSGELIYYGRKDYYGMHTQYHGVLDGDHTAVAQIYPAKCNFKPWISRLGFILLAIGLGLMLLGISFEILSMRAVKKKKNKWNSDPTKSPIKELRGLLWYSAHE